VLGAEQLADRRFRTTLRRLSGADPGAGSSVRKLVGMRHQQDVSEFRYELRGLAGLSLTPDDPIGHGVLQTRCLTIAGGTTEVLKNVAAERILGLPRD
jgi:alkylation response protein AidB-like acyl-CoA dehydrogenase